MMRRRQGFTLVELLVAMALIIFIMAILSQAFVSAMGTFRNLKALGDMAEKLRATTQVLQRDLAADHFEGKKRLSDPHFWDNGPPQQGFFQIVQGSADIVEGNPPPATDTSGIGSYRSTNHALSFTVKLRGNQMSDFFSASGGMAALSSAFGPPEARYQLTSGGSYNYQWAALAWFLVPSGDTAGIDPTTGQPVNLYRLYRRQALLVPDNNLVQPPQSANNLSQFQEMSCWPNGGNLYFNSPIDITDPQRRLWGGTPAYTPLSGALTGADIQLTDVVSFDVRVLPLYPVGTAPPSPDPFVSLFQAPFTSFANGNPSFGSAAVFDTWTSIDDALGSSYATWNQPGQGTSIPLWTSNAVQYVYPVNNTAGQTLTLTNSGPIIQAIQISIRIWDYRTNQTRQVTIVQAM